MTQHKHFKALVRARMARTGERYATARRHLTTALGAEIHVELEAELRTHARHAIAVAFTPDGTELLVGGFGGEASIWSTSDRSRRGELQGHDGSVNGFAFWRDGTHVATVSSDRTARVWDIATRREISEVKGHARGAVAIDVAVDGTLVTGGYDGTVRRWSADGAAIGRIKVGARAVALAAHPSAPWLAVSAGEAEVRIVDLDGVAIEQLAADDVASSIRWSPDGSSLVAGTCAGIHVWAVEAWEPVRMIPLDRADASVVPTAISPDGALLAAGWAHHVGIWRADADAAIATFDGLPKGVYGLAFAPDASRLAQCGADGIVRMWRVDRRGA